MSYDAIVIGAGVVGPCVATALARQGRKVLIVERDWSEPDRIVGELMQPSGLKALKELGMIQAVNNIDAVYVDGYYIKYHDKRIQILYPDRSECDKTNPVKPVPDCVFGDNDKYASNDPSINAAEWDQTENVRGLGFSNGKFLTNLRAIVRAEKNVDWIEGSATEVLRDEEDPDRVIGVKVKSLKGDFTTYQAKVTFACDGIYSKFRKEHSKNNVAAVGSYFVGLQLEDAKLPAPHHGHVILGDHAPVLVYQTNKRETRVLCAYRSTKPPSAANDTFYKYLEQEILPSLPEEIKPSFEHAMAGRKFRPMPNQYLSAPKQGGRNKGFIMLGDSLNMRHPLTGGGMTVGLNDAVLLTKLLHPKQVPELDDYDLISKKLKQFHSKRKRLDAVINTLSIALYSLFAADSRPLKILQEGCFKYFLLGGDCVKGPIGLLSGMLPFPMLLFNHFFSVAFYAIYCNYCDRGFAGFPVALYESFEVIFTAVMVFTPYLWKELVN